MEREFPLRRDRWLHRGRSVPILRSGGSGATIQVIQDLHGGSFFHSPCSHPSVEAYERLLLTTRAENIQLASAERILCPALQFCRSEVYLRTLA
jgi:hypothetical protein